MAVYEDELALIDAALDALHLDPVTRDQYRRDMIDATDAGWFCPTMEEEMRAAIAALQAGGRVPSFPRSG